MTGQRPHTFGVWNHLDHFRRFNLRHLIHAALSYLHFCMTACMLNCPLANRQPIMQLFPRRLPFVHGGHSHPSSAHRKTLPQLFKEHGYWTGAVGKVSATTEMVTAQTLNQYPCCFQLRVSHRPTHTFTHPQTHLHPSPISPQSFQPDLPPKDDYPASWTEPTVQIRTSKSVLANQTHPGVHIPPQGTSTTSG